MFDIIIGMSIEKPFKKKEANVPADKQEEFKELASEGKHHVNLAESHALKAEIKRGRSDEWRTNKHIGIGIGAAGVYTANIPMAASGAAMAAGSYALEKKRKREAEDLDAEATTAAQGAAEQYSKSREIVSEGMKAGGAEKVDGELLATPEQKDAARQEMKSKVEERKRIEEEVD